MEHKQDSHSIASESLRASLIMLSFGLTVLAFLVAINRPEWFHIRPVSGAAAAMSQAAERPLRLDAADAHQRT